MAQRSRDSIAEAVAALRAGGIVAFPTETVYGLGADARSSAAVKKIYAAKGRPATNPSIVHIRDGESARRYAAKWPEAAEKLAAAFWPGPLTLVLEKNDIIVPEATAGRKTVALRVPDHPVALELLTTFDGPIAAPSANRSGRISPTTAEHVRKELGGRVDFVLDGGACRVGVESTVLDLSGLRPVILRPGGISRAEIEKIVGPVDVAEAPISEGEAAASPGMQAVHYSPTTPTYRFDAGHGNSLASGLKGRKAVALLFKEEPLPTEFRIILLPGDANAYARRLYAALHEADGQNAAAILIQMPPDEPAWVAVRDRLKRASKYL